MTDGNTRPTFILFGHISSDVEADSGKGRLFTMTLIVSNDVGDYQQLLFVSFSFTISDFALLAHDHKDGAPV